MARQMSGKILTPANSRVIFNPDTNSKKFLALCLILSGEVARIKEAKNTS